MTGGHATDPETRRQGSSGGVLSALCIYLLESGEVDFVAQVAASKSDPILNELQISRTRADVLRAAGSRYAPSSLLRSLRDLLATGERFAFVGKPLRCCRVCAYMGRHAEVAMQVPYLLSFMCAGIPSIHGTHELLMAMGARLEQLSTFRYCGDGWPAWPGPFNTTAPLLKWTTTAPGAGFWASTFSFDARSAPMGRAICRHRLRRCLVWQGRLP